MNNLIAQALAGTNSKEQATFLNDLGHALRLVCRDRFEQQIAYIADDLDENGRMLCKELAVFADLSMSTRARLETEMQELYRQRRELEEQVTRLREEAAPLPAQDGTPF